MGRKNCYILCLLHTFKPLQPFKAQCLHYTLQGLALQILHAAHFILMCCLWISEQIAVCSLKTINISF
jgi:hypothetical protein